MVRAMTVKATPYTVLSLASRLLFIGSNGRALLGGY